MKKFKLIKEYPNSPELNTIITKIDTYWGYADGHNSNRIVFLSKDRPEDYPEYWEEVVEKEYEILSLIGGSNERILKDSGNIKAWLNGNKDGWRIHSVKRLSDGEVFIIGDAINLPEVIYKFSILKDNSIYINGGDDNKCIHLKDAKHYKQPLFITKDGVDIYEGDTVYGITNDTWAIFHAMVYTNRGSHIETWRHGKFSTREAAEEYVMFNKPQLSFKDVEHLLTKKGKVQLLNKLLDGKK